MSAFTFATAQYDSGDWDSAPQVPANVIDAVARYTSIDVNPAGVIVPLASRDLLRYPLVYLTGHLPVRLASAERDMLRTYLGRGGLLFVDDHNHDVDGQFHKSCSHELARVVGAPLRDIPNGHALYRAFFTFPDGPPATSHELNGWGDNLVHTHLLGAMRGDRLQVLYSNKDYSSEWGYHPDNKRFLSIDNTRFAVNIVVYALTR
ncbi:MAG: DUF4159 domain-containing protein [Gemmatimonadetes bacterium]|nr:DUF4159 domain-containing protein [Gemmatimonadota bacterium]